MSPSTSRKTALITGSTDINALGFTAAYLLALKHDFNVILTGRREDATVAACSELEARLKKSGSKAKVRKSKKTGGVGILIVYLLI
jgi:NAD(P)-dependent dehydrogenase (short-subunit alcohol dehydrogenase family)